MSEQKSLYDCLVQIIQNDYSMNPDCTHILMVTAKLILQNRSQGIAVISERDIAATKQEIKKLDDFFIKEQLDPELIYMRLRLLGPYFEKTGKQTYSEVLHECQNSSNKSKTVDIVHLVRSIIANNPDAAAFFIIGSSSRQFNQYREVLRETDFSSEMSSLDSQDAIMKAIDLFGSALKNKQNDDSSEEVQEHSNVQEPVPEKNKNSDDSMNTGDLASLIRKAKSLRSALYDVVFGQDVAVRTFIRGYFTAQMVSDKSSLQNGPRSCYLFAGPPGVGKTLLAVSAAEFLKVPYYLLNMSQIMMDPESTLNEFLNFVRKNPDCILIIDEFEKAPSTILKLFLQVLDSGKLKNISFSNAHLIFTTNAGRKLYTDMRGRNLSLLDPAVVLSALAKEKDPYSSEPIFPAELLSRLGSGNIVMFNYLSARYLLQIIEKNFLLCSDVLYQKYGCRISYDKMVPSAFLFSRSVNSDARILSSHGQKFIQNEVYEFLRLASNHLNLNNLKEVKFIVQLPAASSSCHTLFISTEKPAVLLVTDRKDFSPTSDFKDKLDIQVETDPDQIIKTIEETDFQLAIVDPEMGYNEATSHGLSLEDANASGVKCLNKIIENSPGTDIYLMNVDQSLAIEDLQTFVRMGVRGSINCSASSVREFYEELCIITKDLYMEERLNDLASRNRILQYNSAQIPSEDGNHVTIELYDLRLKTSVDVDGQKYVLNETERPAERFDDIIGARKAKESLRQFCRYLSDPRKYLKKGRRPPKGILLYGPPGTGKTMLAKAMAGEADASFIAISASDIPAKYLGESEERIRNLFKTARRYAPAVIFIDEIDAIGKQRTGSDTAHHTEGMLNALLTEMDGFKSDPSLPVFVLAATNYSQKSSSGTISSALDSALVRRFDQQILVDLPDESERETYLNRELSKVQAEIDKDVIHNIASRTTGLSLANIQKIIQNAIAAADGSDSNLSGEILLDALEEYSYGEEKKWGRNYYESVARHESGHAYISWLSGKRPAYITIKSRGDFGGYMQNENNENVPSYTEEDMLWQIRVALAGRASEIVFYGDKAGTNTGVSSDLQNATSTVLYMLTKCGMGDQSLLSINTDHILNTAYGNKIFMKAEEILQREFQETIRLCQEGKTTIDQLAIKLLEKNQLTGSEIADVLTGVLS